MKMLPGNLLRSATSMLVMLGTVVGSTALPQTGVAAAAEPAALSVPARALPADLVNEDGTLALDTGFSGSLDLAAWDVTLDPERGPLFRAPESGKPALSSTAALDNWASLGGGGGPTNREVESMAIMGGNLYVGGWFTDFNNIPAADFIAKWDGSNWSAVGDNGYGDGALGYGSVSALAVSGTNLFAGGWFCGVNNGGVYNGKACRIAKWDGSTWTNLGNNGAGGGSLALWVNALGVDGAGNVYAGGAFTNVKNKDGSTVSAADYVAKWDPATDMWSALGSSDGLGTDGSLGSAVWDLAVDGSDVYVGGQFTDVNNNGTPLTAADYIARWDTVGATWNALGNNGGTPANGSINSWVSAIEVDSTGNVYAGGVFQNATNSDGVPVTAADYIAKWNGSAWSALGNNGAVTPNGSVQSWVFDIEVDSSDNVYAVGYFNNVANSDGSVLTAADQVARWDHTSGEWSALGADGGGDGAIVTGAVQALAVDGVDVYVGGAFHGVENGSNMLAHAINLAHWDGSDWLAMTAPQGSLNARVYAVAVSGSNVYVGGDFTDLSDDGTPIPEADYIARWDGTNWHAVGSGSPGYAALASSVRAIAVDGSNVYVGGVFSGVDNGGIYDPAACRIALWDGSDWSGLGTACPINGTVDAIAVDASGNVYAGGYFTNVNNNGTPIPEADYIARWDGSNWSALGSNGSTDGSLNASVRAVVVSGSDVYVGGDFVDVDDATNGQLTEADYVARWNGANWSALGSCTAGAGSLNGSVESLALSGSNLYVGGWFSDACNNVGGPENAADFIARWDGSTWSALGSNGSDDGSLNDAVMTVAVSGGIVYAGGWFTDVNNNGATQDEADFVARWNGANWEALGSDGAGGASIRSPDPSSSAPASVDAIALSSSEAFVGGYFFNVNNGGTVLPYADHVAAYGIEPPGTHLFADVPVTGKEWMEPWIDAFYYAGITTGCGANPLIYCPENLVTRAEMAVFLLRAKHGAGYAPPAPTHDFADVPVTGKEWMEPWIEQFYAEGITTGCGGGNYCPENNVTRAEMAVFVLRALHGGGYSPPPATHTFADVPVTGKEWMEPWIDQFAAQGITTGCGGGNYCPENNVTRAEMAVFIGRAYGLYP